MQEARVPSLLKELKSDMLCGAAKKKRIQQEIYKRKSSFGNRGGIGKVNSALGKLNLRCRVKVLRKLLDESLKFIDDTEARRINVAIWKRPPPPIFLAGLQIHRKQT